MASSLSVSAVRTYGKYIGRGAKQPTVSPDSCLIALLKTKGKETKFAVDVTSQGMYETALCSLTAGINSGMELYQLRRADLEKCTE